jgi:hypothetical protein
LSTARLASLLATALLLAPPADAHIVHGTTTLSRLVAEADVVARARITQAEGLRVTEGPGKGRPLVRADVLDTVKGATVLGERREIRFAQHGHGVAPYENGDDVLVFLRTVERSPELEQLAGSGVRFVSLQEHDERVSLRGPEGVGIADAVRRYTRLEQSPGDRAASFRTLTVELLASPHPRVALSALRDLLVLGDTVPLSLVDVAALARIVERERSPIVLRIGLLADLERRKQIDAPPLWARLVRETRGDERLAAIRAAGAHPSEPVRHALDEIAESGDASAAEASLVALGWPRNDASVPVLARALASEDARRRGAAVRGLVGIGTRAARTALASAATRSPDATTRRSAAAAARRLGLADGRP